MNLVALGWVRNSAAPGMSWTRKTRGLGTVRAAPHHTHVALPQSQEHDHVDGQVENFPDLAHVVLAEHDCALELVVGR